MKLRKCHFGIMKNTLFEHSNGKFVGVNWNFIKVVLFSSWKIFENRNVCSIFEFSVTSFRLDSRLFEWGTSSTCVKWKTLLVQRPFYRSFQNILVNKKRPQAQRQSNLHNYKKSTQNYFFYLNDIDNHNQTFLKKLELKVCVACLANSYKPLFFRLLNVNRKSTSLSCALGPGA